MIAFKGKRIFRISPLCQVEYFFINAIVDSYRFGIGRLTVQPLSLLVGIVYLAINYNKVKGDTADISRSAPDREKVDDFKQRYANQSIEELEALTDYIRYTKEARLAATELLAERVKEG